MQKKNERSKSSRRRGQMAQRRNSEDADKLIARFNVIDSGNKRSQTQRRANLILDKSKLRVVSLGGNDSGGSKNMYVIEYGNDALIMDTGIDLGVNLPGINFAIPDITYLETIKHKIRGYVYTHGHLDHIGSAPYIIPKYPAPVYGSRFTLAMLDRIMENSPATPERFELQPVILNQDNNERLKVGPFVIEFVRVTHSIPGSTSIVIDTPVGRVVNSGDFKIDPDPLDHQPTDLDRFTALGKEGVLLYMGECTTTAKLGRTPTEQTLAPTFDELIKYAPGRVFVALFSTNVNRIQLLIDSAVKHGRKVSFDGRSMLANLEVAVRNGFIRIPKGTVIPMADASNVADKNLLVITTGAQGEENSALRRMSTGDHRHIKLKPQDTAILSSTPIPTTGNDALIEHLVDDCLRKGIHIYQHATHEVDKIGPLHVSGHAARDEYQDMIEMLKPKYFMPIMGSFSAKRYHMDIAVESGVVPRDNCINAELGEIVEFDESSIKIAGSVQAGAILVDNTGDEVPNIVVKDRLLLAQDGLVTVILTLKKGSGQLLTSPDIITRGFIHIKNSEELMNEIRKEAKFLAMRKFKGSKMDDFKQELRDHIQHVIYDRTQRSPIVISVVNVLGGGGNNNGSNGSKPKAAPVPQDKDFES
jgi:ribonuclease J